MPKDHLRLIIRTLNRKAGLKILREISKKPQRFSELIKICDADQGTISTILDELNRRKIIKKVTLDVNKYPQAWTLTKEGIEVYKHLNLAIKSLGYKYDMEFFEGMEKDIVKE